MLRRVTLIQTESGRPLSREDSLLIFKQRPDFIILPEYYNVDPHRRDTVYNAGCTPEHLRYCRALSDRFSTVLIAGSTIECDHDHFYNSAYIYDRGIAVGRYRKANPTVRERDNGIMPGGGPCLLEIDGIRISVLICADVFQRQNFSQLATLDSDIVFIPTTSPLRPMDTITDKFTRDKMIFIDGAREAGSFLVKCCAVGRLWGGDLQGRSLVAAPWGIITRVPPTEEARRRILSITLDITELREFRAKWHRISTVKS
jgi:predicted amidohydrolase